MTPVKGCVVMLTYVDRNVVIGRIKEIRGGMSQAKFSKLIGYSLDAYKSYETGRRSIPLDLLVRVAKYGETTTDWLLGIEPDKSKRPTTMNEMGLRTESIENLKKLNSGPLSLDANTYINRILSSPLLEELIIHIDNLESAYSELYLPFEIRKEIIDKVSDVLTYEQMNTLLLAFSIGDRNALISMRTKEVTDFFVKFLETILFKEKYDEMATSGASRGDDRHGND